MIRTKEKQDRRNLCTHHIGGALDSRERETSTSFKPPMVGSLQKQSPRFSSSQYARTIPLIKNYRGGTSLVVQWLGFHASTAGMVRDTGLIPGQGTKISHATWHGQK